MRLFFRDWLPVILWMFLIFTLSSLPGEAIPSVPVPQADKGAHFFEYSVLGALLIRAFLNLKLQVPLRKLVFGVVLMVLLFAISDEWHQSFVPGRSSEWGEVLWDALSSVAGVGVFCAGIFRINQRKR